MITSMTAYGRTEEQGESGHVIWEIRTVNHRYLEINTRLPDELRMLETAIREHISGKIKRGKIDCVLKFEAKIEESDVLSINKDLAHAVINSTKYIQSITDKAGDINPIDVLRWPNVINRETPDADKVGGVILEQLDRTLDLVVETRLREGKKLHELVSERCVQINALITRLKSILPDILNAMRERLASRAAELSITLDADRLEQEILLLTQRHDITEEIDRLSAHVEEVNRVLNNEGPMGRRLDFLMQELNREANTLGSKSAHYDSSNISVNLKVLIEQIREQVQNIE